MALPAQAMIQEVTYQIEYDGTEDFNLNRTGPGFDAGKKNGIVRTHDMMGYQVTLSTNGPDENPIIKLTLPQHNGKPIASWSMPTQCLQPGSSLSADRQVITCRLENFASSGTKSLVFDATVRGDVRHGTPFPAPAIEVKSDKAPSGVSPEPGKMPATVTVTAAPFYDVRVQLSHNGNPQAFGVQIENGPLPDRQDGFYHRPMIGVFARNPDRGGKKGVEQLDPNTPIEIQLDLSGYPDSVRVLNWDDSAKGSFSDGCGSSFDPRQSANHRPGLFGGGAINTYNKVTDYGPQPARADMTIKDGGDWAGYTVANGGDCSVLPGATRDSLTLSLAGVDTQLSTYPTRLSRTNTPLPPDEFWVANKSLVLWTDLSAYPTDQLVPHTLRFARLTGSSISGQPIEPPQPNGSYHTISHDIKAQAQGSANKTFVPDDGVAAPLSSPKDPAIPSDTIANHVSPTQHVRSALRFSNTGTTAIRDVLLCDILDRTAFDISSRFSAQISPSYLKNPNAVIRYSYGAPPAGQSPYFDSVDTALTPYEVRGKTSIHGTSAYSRASCQNPDIRWFDTPQEAEAAGKLVYVRARVDRLNPNTIALLYLNGLVVRDRWASTTTVQTPVATVRRAGEAIPSGTIIRNRAEITSASVPMDITRQRDHLMVIPTRTTSRVTKTIVEPAAANTAPVAAGSELTYQIEPRYSTLYPPIRDTVTITDILPKGTYYLSGTATFDGAPSEPDVHENTPADGMTTLVWTFPDRLPHFGPDGDEAARLPRITFKARLSNHLANNTLVRNLVSISGGANDFEEDCRYHAASQTLVMTRPTDDAEVLCAKGAQAETHIQTPPGFLLDKSASRTRIQPGDAFDYTLAFVSRGQEISQPNVPDMIDILPFVGDGEDRPEQGFDARQPASSFSPGAYRLVSVTPPARDATARVYYTRRDPKEIHNDPRDPSNDLTHGSTTWCLANDFGTANCPARLDESTAIRISPSLHLLQANIPYEVLVSLQSDPLRAQDGDIFANHVGTRPPDPASKLHYVHSRADLHVRITQTTGSLAGRVFTDVAQNNAFDATDRALAEQCVQLSGTNSKGHTLLLSMRTDAEGRYHFGAGQTQRVFDSGDCSGAPLPRFGGLLDGTYQLTRVEQPTELPGQIHAGTAGGSIDAARQQIAQITLGTGVNATDYNFTEQPKPPKLTLISTVTNTHGGTATPDDILMTAGQPGLPPAVEGVNGNPAVTGATLPPGGYVS